MEDQHSISILKNKLEGIDVEEVNMKDLDTLKMVYDNVLDITTAVSWCCLFVVI